MITTQGLSLSYARVVHRNTQKYKRQADKDEILAGRLYSCPMPYHQLTAGKRETVSLPVERLPGKQCDHHPVGFCRQRVPRGLTADLRVHITTQDRHALSIDTLISSQR